MHLGRPHDRPARDVAQREVPRRVQIDDISLYQVQPLIPEYVYPQARVVSQATDQELPADLIGCEEREQCSRATEAIWRAADSVSLLEPGVG